MEVQFKFIAFFDTVYFGKCRIFHAEKWQILCTVYIHTTKIVVSVVACYSAHIHAFKAQFGQLGIPSLFSDTNFKSLFFERWFGKCFWGMQKAFSLSLLAFATKKKEVKHGSLYTKETVRTISAQSTEHFSSTNDTKTNISLETQYAETGIQAEMSEFHQKI